MFRSCHCRSVTSVPDLITWCVSNEGAIVDRCSCTLLNIACLYGTERSGHRGQIVSTLYGLGASRCDLTPEQQTTAAVFRSVSWLTTDAFGLHPPISLSLGVSHHYHS